jgi:hypothetical protein
LLLQDDSANPFFHSHIGWLNEVEEDPRAGSGATSVVSKTQCRIENPIFTLSMFFGQMIVKFASSVKVKAPKS